MFTSLGIEQADNSIVPLFYTGEYGTKVFSISCKNIEKMQLSAVASIGTRHYPVLRIVTDVPEPNMIQQEYVVRVTLGKNNILSLSLTSKNQETVYMQTSSNIAKKLAYHSEDASAGDPSHSEDIALGGDSDDSLLSLANDILQEPGAGIEALPVSEPEFITPTSPEPVEERVAPEDIEQSLEALLQDAPSEPSTQESLSEDIALGGDSDDSLLSLANDILQEPGAGIEALPVSEPEFITPTPLESVEERVAPEDIEQSLEALLQDAPSEPSQQESLSEDIALGGDSDDSLLSLANDILQEPGAGIEALPVSEPEFITPTSPEPVEERVAPEDIEQSLEALLQDAPSEPSTQESPSEDIALGGDSDDSLLSLADDILQEPGAGIEALPVSEPEFITPTPPESVEDTGSSAEELSALLVDDITEPNTFADDDTVENVLSTSGEHIRGDELPDESTSLDNQPEDRGKTVFVGSAASIDPDASDDQWDKKDQRKLSRKISKIVNSSVYGNTYFGKVMGALLLIVGLLLVLVAVGYIFFYLQTMSSLDGFFSDPFAPLRIERDSIKVLIP